MWDSYKHKNSFSTLYPVPCTLHLRFLLILGFLFFLFFSQETHAHVFSLYADTNEETKERIRIDLSSSGFSIEYKGEYHGQLAAHIRFMMDTDQDSEVSPNEVHQFTNDYQQMWHANLQNRKISVDNSVYNLKFVECSYPGLEKSNLVDPLFVTMKFRIDGFQIRKLKKNKGHLLEIHQKMLFQFAQLFIKMSKTRAAFTNEQENAISRFFQVSVHAADHIQFTRCHPGYLNRKKNSISGIFFDETITRIQFLPYPTISASFVVIGKDYR